MANVFAKATDAEMVDLVKQTVASLNNQLEEIATRDIALQVTMTEKEYHQMKTPVFRVTGAWKQLHKPLIFTP